MKKVFHWDLFVLIFLNNEWSWSTISTNFFPFTAALGITTISTGSSSTRIILSASLACRRIRFLSVAFPNFLPVWTAIRVFPPSILGRKTKTQSELTIRLPIRYISSVLLPAGNRSNLFCLWSPNSGRLWIQTVNFFLPLALRRFKTFLPPDVCVLFK